MRNLITVLPQGLKIEYAKGRDLLSILQSHGLLLDVPCSGRGTCGKCRVKVIKGSLPPAGEEETAFLTDGELSSGIRMACLVLPDGELTLELGMQEQGHKVLTDGYQPTFSIEPPVRLVRFEPPHTGLELQQPLDELLMDATKSRRISFSALKSLPLEDGEPRFTAFCYGDELLKIEAGETEKAYGLAIDIGTTTVVVSLVDLCSGEELAVRSSINAQKEFGLDVLTRITYISEHPDDGLGALQSAIVGSINDMILELCQDAEISPINIYDIAVAANNTMQHILLGVSPEPIGRAPFAPVFSSAQTVTAADVGLYASDEARLYCLPSTSSYIGADIVAGAYVCGLHEETKTVIFIDIGTNGEIVLVHNGKMTSCSCAAGPALEGMNISCGMRAADGAVEDVHIGRECVSIKTIGQKSPQGLCGSGIISAVSEICQTGLCRPDGKIEKVFPNGDYRRALIDTVGGKPAVKLADGIYVTQKDIRQVQLAKGAILSGFCALLEHSGISMEHIDKILIAGQFGAHLSAKSLIGCGILPRGAENKVTYVGNTSKTGAYMALLSLPVRKEMERIAKSMNYLELSVIDGYERLFMRCLSYPEPQDGDEEREI